MSGPRPLDEQDQDAQARTQPPASGDAAARKTDKPVQAHDDPGHRSKHEPDSDPDPGGGN